MKLEQILEEYANREGLERLDLDERGICRILVNETSIVSLEKSVDGIGFYLYATIGTIPSEREHELGMLALSGNLFGRETGRANLGYLPETQTLVLFKYLEEAHTDYPAFERAFEQFMQYLAYWMNKLEVKESPDEKELSIDKHVFSLPEHKNLKIFFA